MISTPPSPVLPTLMLPRPDQTISRWTAGPRAILLTLTLMAATVPLLLLTALVLLTLLAGEILTQMVNLPLTKWLPRLKRRTRKLTP